MIITKKIPAGFCVGVVLMLCAFGAVAADSHIPQAIKHAEAAAKSTDGKSLIEHAEAANGHVKTADDHLDAGAKSLSDAIEQAKAGHVDLAKKAAEEAVTHLKAAE